jgi:hypothetical protein
MVVGKGVSMPLSDTWTGPIISCNHAILHTQRGYLARFDSLDADNRTFLTRLPAGVIAILPVELRGLYPEDIMVTFAWHELSLSRSQPTSVYAIAVAAALGATEIVCAGLDYVFDGNPAYAMGEHDSLQPARLASQVRRYRQLPADVIAITRSAAGKPLRTALAQQHA